MQPWRTSGAPPSHDLRSLLGGIALAAAMQIKSATDDDHGRSNVKTAERIQRFTARMNRLIGDLLDVSSIEAGRLAVSPQRAAAAKLVQDALELFQSAAAAKQVALTVTGAHGPIDALADEGRILQVLVNLLGNALKFTRQGGAVTVSASVVNDQIRFEVTDDGPGIAPEHLESIFERFWQVTQRASHGVGLGLFISRSVVEAHGGRIWAESLPGKGSSFFFTLPRTK